MLVGEAGDGWVVASHMSWMTKRLNDMDTNTIACCVNVASVDEFQRTIDRKNDVERIVFVLNVGKRPDNTVFISGKSQFNSDATTGSHWAIVAMDVTDQPTLLYGDSLGWSAPPYLLEYLSAYTSVFGLTLQPQDTNLVLLHTPAPAGYNHRCTATCLNYPLQTCGTVCGIVAFVSCVIATLDYDFFLTLTSRRSGMGLFLQQPTSYERYLRRVLADWFVWFQFGTCETCHLHPDP